MYEKIMVPVDLGHVDALRKSLSTAADLAKYYGASIVYVSVTAATPGPVARTPEAYQQKLQAFADEQAVGHGCEVSAKTYVSHDPAVDLDDTLIKAVHETAADLVVMATHLPRRLDAIIPSNGGKIATHTGVSVFLVRP